MGKRRRLPSTFIGSSSEGLPVAETIQENLDKACEVAIWSQGVFGLSRGTLEELVEAIPNFDFATLVLTPDDMIESRAKKQPGPRDNVLIELGLCVGALGRFRTFVVHDRKVKLPSDMAGVTLAGFEPHSSGNLVAALGASCTKIKTAMAGQGLRQRTHEPEPSSSPSPSLVQVGDISLDYLSVKDWNLHQAGGETTPDGVPGLRRYRTDVEFPAPFPPPPQVVVALNKLDAAPSETVINKNLRIYCTAEGITKTGFVLVVATWDISTVHTSGVTWTAVCNNETETGGKKKKRGSRSRS